MEANPYEPPRVRCDLTKSKTKLPDLLAMGISMIIIAAVVLAIVVFR
jgi:hypothetical protein